VAAAGAALAAVWIGALRAAGAYDRGVLADHRSTRAIRVAPALPLAVLLLAALRGTTIDAPRLAALTVVVASASYLQHTLAGLARTRTRAPARVVLAGHPHGVRWLLDDLETSGRLSVVAVCVTEAVSRGDFAAPVVTGWENLRSCVREHAAEAVVVVPCRHVDPDRIRRAGWDLEAARDGTGLFVASGLPEAGVAGARVTTAGRVPLVPVRWARTSGAARWAKSVGERVVAAVALVVVAPLLLALAALIRLESPGPAVFRQTRIGKGGVPFTMLKLRTMCADAAQLQASLSATTPAELMLFKLRADPRITRLGRFLRTYSLDELPQLVNVVCGQMALVGPRPALPCEVERYERDVFRRLTVTPGMTGLWQVSGRSDLSWEEAVRLDLHYVDDWTPGLDLRILLRTVGAVLGHRGAY
ncbi:exopolysaccharide biosynthesis polyprenyl glycosylphosphotransferase, partial [Nocardioides sp.]|uniref:exopolysaccharide biosynthesis polyprenyl glycosylphosphotransferase n=1 Tax=Nocardioides sp. TaxID=35761 RepID=UPI002ED831DD